MSDRITELARALRSIVVGWPELMKTGSGGGDPSTLVNHNHASTLQGGLVSHNVLTNITANQHHDQVHTVDGSDHSVTGSQYQLVGVTSPDHLGLLTPSYNPGAAAGILRTDDNGYLQLVRLGLGKAPTVPVDAAADVTDGSLGVVSGVNLNRTGSGNNRIGVYGECLQADDWGIGVKGVGLYQGVVGVVTPPTGDGSYQGVYGEVTLPDNPSTLWGGACGLTGLARGGQDASCIGVQGTAYNDFDGPDHSGVNGGGFFSGYIDVSTGTSRAAWRVKGLSARGNATGRNASSVATASVVYGVEALASLTAYDSGQAAATTVWAGYFSPSTVVSGSGSPSATATTVKGIEVYPSFSASAGTIAVTTLYGLHLTGGYKSGATSIGTCYGLYIDEQSLGGTNWNLYSAGATGKHYLAGSLGVGTESPVAKVGIAYDTEQLRLIYASDPAKYAKFTLGAEGMLTVSAIGHLVLDPVNGGNGRVLPGGSIEDDLGYYNRKWRTLFAQEMYLETLVAQDVMATIGGRIVVSPSTSLIANVGTADTAIDVKYNNLHSGSGPYTGMYLLFEGFGWDGGSFSAQYEVMKTADEEPTVIPGGYRYNVTRNLQGTGAKAWDKGDSCTSLQYAANTGWLELTSTATRLQHLGPNLTIYTRTGTTNWNDAKPTVAMGNLDSFLGYGAVYGFAVGDDLTKDPAADTTLRAVAVDRTNGVRLWNVDLTLYDAGIPKTRLVRDEGLLISSGTWGTDTSVFGAVFADDPTLPNLDAGDVVIGTYWHSSPASQKGLWWDNSAHMLNLKGAAAIKGGSPVVVDGAGLYLGSDYMGYHDGSAWKTFLNSSGDFRFAYDGNNYLQFLASANKLRGVGGGVEQWYANATNGKLCAGGGAVVLDVNGETLYTQYQQGTFGTNTCAIKWIDVGGANVAGVNGGSSPYANFLSLYARHNGGVESAPQVTIHTFDSTGALYTPWLRVDKDYVWLSGPTKVDGGLNVGNATGAPAGTGFFDALMAAASSYYGVVAARDDSLIGTAAGSYSGNLLNILGNVSGYPRGLHVYNRREVNADNWWDAWTRLAATVVPGDYPQDHSYNNLSWIEFAWGKVSIGGNVLIGTATDSGYKLDVNGTIHYTSLAASSDVRLKTKIEPIGNALALVRRLRGVRFEWNERVNRVRDGYKLGKPTYGLIAQELETVLPELVSTWKLDDEITDAKAVCYERLVPILVEAIKELDRRLPETSS